VSKKKSTKRQQKFKTIFTRSQREGKRKQNAEYKRKLREDTNYKEKGAQQARRRYHKKQEQLQFFEFGFVGCYYSKSKFGDVNSGAAASKVVLNQSCWEEFTERNLGKCRQYSR